MPSAVAVATPAVAVAAVRASAEAAFTFPSDFPSAAKTGAQQRFSEAAWDQGGASSPVLKLDGPGSNGAKAFVYTRADGTSVAVVYVPTGVAIASGWVSISFGLKASVPLTATYGSAWADQSPGIGATTLTYFTMSRVALFDLLGTGSTSAPSASPTGAPKPTPTPVSTASPAPTAAPVDGTSCTHFVANPVCHQLPAHPAVSSNSAAWAALEFQAGRAYVPSFSAEPGPDPFHDTNDGSDPPLDELKVGGASIVQTIECNAAWGPTVCGSHGLQGAAIAVPAGMEPAGNSDHHYSFNDDARQREVDFWLAQGVPTTPGAKLYIGAGGVCAWSGDGTNCSGSDATNIAQSLGSIDEADYQRGEAGPSASFGHAISFSALCADPSYVYPATASDGSNTNGSSACSGHTGTNGRPPEGTRVYLDMSDAQVNAMALPAYAKAWWRTFDREHEGGFIADTNWSGAPGLSPAYQRDNFSQQAREAGVTVAPYAQVPLGLGTIDMAHNIKFCSNGTC